MTPDEAELWRATFLAILSRELPPKASAYTRAREAEAVANQAVQAYRKANKGN